MALYLNFDDIVNDCERAKAKRLYFEHVTENMSLCDKLELRHLIIKGFEKQFYSYD